MKSLADLIEAAERLQAVAAQAMAECAVARARLEEIQRSANVDHAQLLAGLALLRARLQTTEARQ
jgi:hypothetical protein